MGRLMPEFTNLPIVSKKLKKDARKILKRTNGHIGSTPVSVLDVTTHRFVNCDVMLGTDDGKKFYLIIPLSDCLKENEIGGIYPKITA